MLIFLSNDKQVDSSSATGDQNVKTAAGHAFKWERGGGGQAFFLFLLEKSCNKVIGKLFGSLASNWSPIEIILTFIR